MLLELNPLKNKLLKSLLIKTHLKIKIKKFKRILFKFKSIHLIYYRKVTDIEHKKIEIENKQKMKFPSITFDDVNFQAKNDPMYI